MNIDTELIFLALKNRCSESERAAVEAWRRARAENEQEYRAYERILAASSESEASRPAPQLSKPAELIRRAESQWTGNAVRWPLRRWGLRTLAAAGLVVLGISLAEIRDRGPETSSFTADEFVTGPFQKATVSLHDGTVVRLAPDSRLKRTAGGKREVTFAGRGYFAVASDPDHPFRIHTNSGDVEVLGTRFDLSAQPEHLRVVVVQGHVAVSVNGQRREARAGQETGVARGAALPVESVQDVQADLQWTGNFLAFQSTPLRVALAEVEQHYSATITIADSALMEATVDAWFSDRPLDEVLEVLCAIVGAEYTMRDDSIVVRPT